ncbi:VIT1/CCC1 transporter family protein [Spirillospora sp. NPDC047279]|uniref:VIT1/CCC1 transporter family protein n=1 Tax=Spirillospora sp. NPDC047279 TaxID=3155478 RepID=UPI0033E62677
MRRKRDTTATLAHEAHEVKAGAARAAVLGVNDGLVSTLCIILGVAGAGSGQNAVRLAGLAGLIAGAVSMAAGEWISVTAQVELFKGVLGSLKGLIANDRAELIDKLAQTFRNDVGLSEETARKAAEEIGSDDTRLYETSALRLVGITTDELGSPWTAALSSLLLFTLGGLAPLLPWLFGSGAAAVVWSIALTAAGGLVVGGVVARSSDRPVPYGAFRQLLIILLAAGVTYGCGLLVGGTGLG